MWSVKAPQARSGPHFQMSASDYVLDPRDGEAATCMPASWPSWRHLVIERQAGRTMSPARRRRGRDALLWSSRSAGLNSQSPPTSYRYETRTGSLCLSSRLGTFSPLALRTASLAPQSCLLRPRGSRKWKVPVQPHLVRYFSFRIYYPKDTIIAIFIAILPNFETIPLFLS